MNLKQDLKKEIQTLQSIVSRKGSSKILTFSVPHVFKALQLLHKDRFVSRSTFCKQLHIGEGAVKTLILHLKSKKIVESTRSGTYLTEKGKKFSKTIIDVIPNETTVKKSKIFGGKYNHAVLIKNHAHVIKTGLEQRDFAILYGASIALTLIYQNGKFSFPGEAKDALLENKQTQDILMKMNPEENDVIIITSADDSFVAEVSVKNSALWTIAS